MNIQEAKNQIKNAITAYLTKDEYDNYMIPTEKQRPVFLIGAPRIGKTAIIEQIAQELDLPVVSYSMTHHTRQSALGLPFISQKNYDGKEYSVSEYTMSEIIASVYDMREKTGKKEGILFLDEINCVSETLSPVMLQFLQYKVFGKHRVPDGWIIVTAGNPPEYNNSVHDFDIVTLDRLKKIDVAPDYYCWRSYAVNANIHPSIISFLDANAHKFYKVETTAEGKSFITARGWEDLSRMINVYEKNDVEVDSDLICQYIQNNKIARDFSCYYDLFNKYKSDYRVDKIIDGEADDEIKSRAREAKFDERIALLSVLTDGIISRLDDVILNDEVLSEYMTIVKNFKSESARVGFSAENCISNEIKKQSDAIEIGKAAGTLSVRERKKHKRVISTLESVSRLISDDLAADDAFAVIKDDFDLRKKENKKIADTAKKQLDNVFKFLDEAFGDNRETLIFTTEMTINKYASKFLARYGSDEYFCHNKDMLVYGRQAEIDKEIESLSGNDDC